MHVESFAHASLPWLPLLRRTDDLQPGVQSGSRRDGTPLTRQFEELIFLKYPNMGLRGF
jgi:hypothetical protein